VVGDISIQRRRLVYLSFFLYKAFLQVTSIQVIKEKVFLLINSLDFYVYVYPLSMAV